MLPEVRTEFLFPEGRAVSDGGVHVRTFVVLLTWVCSVCENSLGCTLMTWPFFYMYIMSKNKKKLKKEIKEEKAVILHQKPRIKVRSLTGYIIAYLLLSLEFFVYEIGMILIT